MTGLLIGGGFIVDLTTLSPKQRDLLDTLKRSILSNSNFYLAGGTGLALQLSHRKSIDFDFFSSTVFSPTRLLDHLKVHFVPGQINIMEMKEGTLIVMLKNIQTSFFHYQYPLLNKLIVKNGLNVASIEDISAMKVIAIIQRGSKKDFIDLWAIIKEKQYSLKDIFSFCQQKYDTIFSESVALKALVYFQDAEEERIELGMKSNFSWDIVKNDLTTISREYLNKYLQKS